MKRVAIALCGAALSTATAAAQNMYVYRTDNEFNKIELHDGVEAQHILSGEKRLSISDISSGQNTSVPLSVIDRCEIRATDIPELYFSFPDYPQAEWVWDKENYIDATLDIRGNHTAEDATELQLTVKGRGNSTWSMPKKPMRMKFKSKTSICGFKKAKNYVLLADYIDNTLMHNATGLWFAQRLGIPYSNHIQPCNVYVNGHYAGEYLMTEKIGINSGSVDIDETEGILFELSTEFDEIYKFRSENYNLPVMVKDPDFSELYEDAPTAMSPEERLAMWQADFNEAESHAGSPQAFEYFDLDSFVDYMLVQNLAKNHEMGWPKSVYIHKERTGTDSKYVFGPVWDLDANFNSMNKDGDNITESQPSGEIWLHEFFSTLMNHEEFKQKYNSRLAELKNTIMPEMLEWFDGYAACIEPAARLNGLKWNLDQDLGWIYRTSSFDTEKNVARLREWLINRVNYLTRDN